jgi:hypothetical protein
MATLDIGQGRHPTAAHGADQGIGGPQVDAGGQALLVGGGGTAWLRDL